MATSTKQTSTSSNQGTSGVLAAPYTATAAYNSPGAYSSPGAYQSAGSYIAPTPADSTIPTALSKTQLANAGNVIDASLPAWLQISNDDPTNPNSPEFQAAQQNYLAENVDPTLAADQTAAYASGQDSGSYAGGAYAAAQSQGQLASYNAGLAADQQQYEDQIQGRDDYFSNDYGTAETLNNAAVSRAENIANLNYGLAQNESNYNQQTAQQANNYNLSNANQESNYNLSASSAANAYAQQVANAQNSYNLSTAPNYTQGSGTGTQDSTTFGLTPSQASFGLIK